MKKFGYVIFVVLISIWLCFQEFFKTLVGLAMFLANSFGKKDDRNTGVDRINQTLE